MSRLELRLRRKQLVGGRIDWSSSRAVDCKWQLTFGYQRSQVAQLELAINPDVWFGQHLVPEATLALAA